MWINEDTVDITRDRAFVYRIVFADGLKYIGYKTVYTKGGKETGWKTYQSSSKYVKEKIALGDQYTAEILYTFPTREEALAKEEELLRSLGALKDPQYLNKSIGGSKFSCYPATEAHKKKLSEAKIGVTLGEQHSKNISSSLKTHYESNPRTKEHIKNNISTRTTRKKVVSLVLNGTRYTSVREAALAEDLSEYRIRKMIKSGDPNVSATFKDLRVISSIIIDEHTFYSYKEAALYVGVTQTTIKRRIEKGQYTATYK